MLYRKYRPATFPEVVGQEHVIKTLQGALTTGRIGHAYLFCGPRGTGKTTIARLLAKGLNCKDYILGTLSQVEENPDIKIHKEDIKKKIQNGQIPCGKCEFCQAIKNNNSLDLIEIDAASNRGIDEIRSLKESAMVAAPGGNYKIFVIDEVHALTKDAFNALLKILEEPPAHVVFILATTEPHKILPTVLSRVQRFDFKRLNPKQTFEKLKYMAKAEKVDIEEEGLMAIAMSSDGALRDAEVSLSKVIASSDKNNKISTDNVYESLGLIPLNYYPEFLSFLAANDKNNALDFINKAYISGIDMGHFVSGFVEYLRKVLMHRINPAVLASVGEELLDQDLKVISAHSQVLTQDQLIRLLNIFMSAKEGMKSSPIPQLPLELAVLESIK